MPYLVAGHPRRSRPGHEATYGRRAIVCGTVHNQAELGEVVVTLGNELAGEGRLPQPFSMASGHPPGPEIAKNGRPQWVGDTGDKQGPRFPGPTFLRTSRRNGQRFFGHSRTSVLRAHARRGESRPEVSASPLQEKKKRRKMPLTVRPASTKLRRYRPLLRRITGPWPFAGQPGFRTGGSRRPGGIRGPNSTPTARHVSQDL